LKFTKLVKEKSDVSIGKREPARRKELRQVKNRISSRGGEVSLKGVE